MIRISAALALLFFLVDHSGNAQSGKAREPMTLFTLGERPVTVDEFIYLYRKNHSADTPGEYSPEKVEEYLDLFVKFKLKVEEALRRKMDTTAAFVKEFNTYREELRKPYLPDHRLLDSLVHLTYSRMKEEIRASHILINVGPDASPEDTLQAYRKIVDIRNRILNGEEFATLAARYSQDPSAAVNKGDLGYFTALQMVFPFENAAYGTPVGEVSQPVRTQFGYHVVKVTERKPARGEVLVSHIMLRTDDDADNEETRKLIFDIYDRLQKGVPWEDLCAEYSEDPSSKNDGGRLRPFGVGAMAMSGAPEFEAVAFGMNQPGQISDPVQTQFGWHIIRLESKIPLPSFETISASLRNRVSRNERARLSKEKIQMKMRAEFGFTEDLAVKEKILTLADSSLLAGNWRNEAGTMSGSVLFSMAGNRYTVSDFFHFAELNKEAGAGKRAASLYDRYVSRIQGDILEEKIKRENPEYRWLLNEYYEGILLFEIMEQEVWSRASADSLGQREYYERHSDAYQADERVQATIYSSSSKTDIAELRLLAAMGDSSAIEQFAVERKIRRERGNFEKTDRPVLSGIDWAKGIHVGESNGMHYLVDVSGILPPGKKTFHESRAAVISDFQNELERRWIERLKQKFPVKMNRKGRTFLEKQLVKK